MSPLIIDVAILLILLVLGVPIPLCFAGAAMYLGLSTGMDMGQMMSAGFSQLNSITLLAVAAFILAGGLMNVTGIADRLVVFAEALVGRVRGGLGGVCVVACAIIGAIAGTCSAAVASMGTVLIPKMEEQGYSRGYATGLVACASVLGQLIPPSLPMVLFGFVLQLSVAACFLSTVGPGIILVIIYVTINRIMVGRMPQVATQPAISLRQQLGEIKTATRRGAWALVMPVIILGSIYGGLAIPTEAATISCVYAIFIGFVVYKGLTKRKLYGTFLSMGITTGVIILMIYFVMMLGRLYAFEQIPQKIAEGMVGISTNYYVVLILINVFLILIGMLMDDSSGTLLAAPLLFPVIKEIGVNPYHFAAIMGTNLGLGNVTPPCAPMLYLAARIGNVPFEKVIKPALMFMVFGSLPVVLITTYWPDLALFLPRLAFPDIVP
jgi:C4-dicarboxylate transporter DctM subunit